MNELLSSRVPTWLRVGQEDANSSMTTIISTTKEGFSCEKAAWHCISCLVRRSMTCRKSPCRDRRSTARRSIVLTSSMARLMGPDVPARFANCPDARSVMCVKSDGEAPLARRQSAQREPAYDAVLGNLKCSSAAWPRPARPRTPCPPGRSYHTARLPSIRKQHESARFKGCHSPRGTTAHGILNPT